jgi:hypothetical protein
MSAVIESINISNLLSRPKPITETVTVGKDILELLAGSMYVDPLNIYREYIQNSADAIDQALDQNLHFETTPGVEIAFDHLERTIRIRDNGVGIPTDDFVRRLVTIGSSQKRGKKLRGFRGVGRLSGLGYCQELIFRGRSEGEAKITELRWDGRALREKMRDHTYSGHLGELVQEVVTINRLSADGFPNRFFEVELRKVSRLRNDLLLNEQAVRNYLSQVAPVPFDERFSFGKKIAEKLALQGIRPPIRIELNDGAGPIVHRVQNAINLSETVTDHIRGVEHIEIKDADGVVCAVGWIADHSYSGSIPKRLGIGGIRLRVGNIQVGEDSILAPLFPEARFAGWAIGDIHVVSPKILPNGRRDEFEPSSFYAHFQGELAIHAKAIAQRIRERSSQRNQLLAVQQHMGAVDAWLKVADEKPLPQMILNILHELAVDRLDKVSKEASRLAVDTPESQITAARVKKLEKLVHALPSRKKKEVSKNAMKKQLEKPIAAALKTIVESAKTPAAGIALSLDVLCAIDAAS